MYRARRTYCTNWRTRLRTHPRVAFRKILLSFHFFFFFQAEDGIRDLTVTGVQTCALPICRRQRSGGQARRGHAPGGAGGGRAPAHLQSASRRLAHDALHGAPVARDPRHEIGRAAWRGRGEISGGAVSLKKKKKRKEGRMGE